MAARPYLGPGGEATHQAMTATAPAAPTLADAHARLDEHHARLSALEAPPMPVTDDHQQGEDHDD